MQSAWEEVGQLEKAAREATPSGTLTHSSAPFNVWENPPQSSPQLPVRYPQVREHRQAIPEVLSCGLWNHFEWN